MQARSNIIQPSRRRRSGVALAEYGLLGILITVTCLTAMQFLGGSITKIVNDSCYSITTAINGAMGH